MGFEIFNWKVINSAEYVGGIMKSIIPVTELMDCTRYCIHGLLSDYFFINTQLLFHGPRQWVSDNGIWAEAIVKLCLYGIVSFLLLCWDVPVGVWLLFSHAPGFSAVLGAAGSGYPWTDQVRAVLAKSLVMLMLPAWEPLSKIIIWC